MYTTVLLTISDVRYRTVLQVQNIYHRVCFYGRYMHTIGVAFNIRCMFPSGGDGTSIPQVLLSMFCVCYHPVLQVHVYHRFCFRWRYMYTNILVSPGVIYSITLHSSRMQCNGIDYAWGYEDSIPQVLLAIYGVF